MQHLRELLEDFKRGVADLEEVIGLKEELDDLHSTVSDREEQVEKLDKELDDLRAEKEKLTLAFNKRKARIKSELDEAEAKVARTRAEAAEKLKQELRVEEQVLETTRMESRRQRDEHKQWLDAAVEERAKLEHELVELRTAKRALGR